MDLSARIQELRENNDYSETQAKAIAHAEANEGNLSEHDLERLENAASVSKEILNEDPCWEDYEQVGTKTQDGEVVPNCVPKDDVENSIENADNCPEGYQMVNGVCVKSEHVDDVPPSSLSGGAQFPKLNLSEADIGKIERLEEGDNTVRYTNMKLLGPGKWTDSGSGETILYSEDTMHNLRVKEDNTANIMHDTDNEVSETGEIDADSVTHDDSGIYADILLDTSNAAGQYADENLQKTLETKGTKGFGGPSVEIDAEGQEVETSKPGVKELVKGVISGFGLVKNPAAKNTAFDRQVAARGVALSEGQNHYTLEQESNGMDTIDVAGLASELELTEEEASKLLEEYQLEEEEEEEDPEEEMPEEMENEGEEEEPPEEEEEEEKDMMDESAVVDMINEQLDDVWGEIDKLKSEMMGEEMAEELADADTVEEVEARLSEVEDTTKKLAEEPKEPRTMADAKEGDSIFDSGRRMTSTDSTGTTGR